MGSPVPNGAELDATRRGRTAGAELEAVGAVPVRAAVGHRARGLLAATATAGTTSRTTTPGAAPIAGARTACSASPTASVASASRSRSGTATIRSSRNGCSASRAPRAITARTSRSATTTSTPRRRTPTCKALYKYPQRAFPYGELVAENARRGKHEAEYELADTGVFDDNRYFDVTAEYAKGGARRCAGPHHGGEPRARTRRRCTCCRRSGFATRGAGAAPVRTFRRAARSCCTGEGRLRASHATLGSFTLFA